MPRLNLRDVKDALDALELPCLVENDVLVWPQDGRWSNEAGETVHFFDPDGIPFPGDLRAQAAAFEAITVAAREDLMNRRLTPYFIKSALAWRGTAFVVHTSYLGSNTQFFAGPPLIWETMISIGGEWCGWAWRYSTANAARAGHATIVDTLVSCGMPNIGMHGLDQ